MHGTEEASNGGKVKVRIIHGLNISQKEIIYLLQKSTSHQKPSITRMLLGEQIGRKRPSIVPDRHSKGRQLKNTSCFKFFTQRLPYVHVMGPAIFNTSISQIHNYSTSTTLISPSLYLKTIIKYQTSHSMQCNFFMKVFIIPILDAYHIRTNFIAKENYHAVLKDYQNNIGEALEINNFYKIEPPLCSKRYK